MRSTAPSRSTSSHTSSPSYTARRLRPRRSSQSRSKADCRAYPFRVPLRAGSTAPCSNRSLAGSSSTRFGRRGSQGFHRRSICWSEGRNNRQDQTHMPVRDIGTHRELYRKRSRGTIRLAVQTLPSRVPVMPSPPRGSCRACQALTPRPGRRPAAGAPSSAASASPLCARVRRATRSRCSPLEPRCHRPSSSGPDGDASTVRRLHQLVFRRILHRCCGR